MRRATPHCTRAHTQSAQRWSAGDGGSTGLQDGEPDALSHGRLGVEQVGKKDAVEDFVDAALEHNPDRPNAALMRARAADFVDRMAFAVHIERDQFRRGDDLPHRDFDRGPRERISAARAARARHDSGAAKTEEDLLDVVSRQPLAGRDVASVDGALIRTLRQMKRADYAVLGPSGDAHIRIVREIDPNDKTERSSYSRSPVSGMSVTVIRR